MSISLFRFLPAAALISAGVALLAIGVAGVFRIKYALNRLHAAAIGDSLGMPLVAAGLIVLYGWSMVSAKILFIVALFWLASPVCSHLLSSLEASTNDKLEQDCAVIPLSALDDSASGSGEERNG